MLDTFFGKKINQAREFTPEGIRMAVTYVKVAPCTVIQIKTPSTDGYWALQLGIDHKINTKVTKPLQGHLKKTGQGNFLPRFLREVRLQEDAEKELPYKIGDTLSVDSVFQVGDNVKVTGISKAKGFQGGVKRHNFKGGPRTHGQSDRERAPGSIGQTTTPGRVYKGKRMAGHMGGEQITIKGLKVLHLDKEKQLLTIKGLIPGIKTGLVTIQKQ